jgi:hypothetical protein
VECGYNFEGLDLVYGIFRPGNLPGGLCLDCCRKTIVPEMIALTLDYLPAENDF